MTEAGIDAEDLRARAASLGERLAAAATMPLEGEPSFAASLRLARWRQVTAAGRPQRFAEMLQRRGIPAGVAARALEPAAASCGPDWVPSLERWLSAAAECARGPAPEWTSAPDAPRNSALVWPLALACEARIHERCAAPMLRAPAVRSSLQRTCARWLGNIVADAVQRRPEGAAELQPLLTGHPALARLVASVADDWTAATAEFAERCTADQPAITAMFAGGAPVGDPVAVELDRSDPHHGLRTVAFVTFASGLRLVYKPRPLGLDAAFAAFVADLNATGRLPPLRAPRILSRPSHGWAELIEVAPPAAPADRHELCRRAGALTAVLWLLDATDAHDENVLIAGPDPVLVDAETILHPRYWLVRMPPSLDTGAAAAWREHQMSVRRTHMVSDGRLPAEEQRSAAALTMLLDRWLTVGLPGEEFIALVDEGFDAAMTGLRAIGRDPAAVDGLLARFAGTRGRVVVRGTERYAKAFHDSLLGECLRDGFERSLTIERLATDIAVPYGPDLPAALLETEIAALERGDIPYFTGAVDRDEIGGVAGLAETLPLVQAKRNFTAPAQLCEAQARILEGGLRAHIAPVDCAPAPAELAISEPIDEVVAAAVRRIVGDLRSVLHLAEDGSFGAHGLTAPHASDQFHYGALPRTCFRGTVGLGLFLIAATRTDEAAFAARLATGIGIALRTQLHSLRDVLAVPALEQSHGEMWAATAEMIYGGLAAARLANDAGLLDQVHAAVDGFAALPPVANERAAMVALVLARCAEQFDDPSLRRCALELARRCLDRLDRRAALALRGRDPAAYGRSVHAFAVIGRTAGDEALVAAASRLATPPRPGRFEAALALAAALHGTVPVEAARPLDADSLERGASGWLELPLSEDGVGSEAALRAAAEMVVAAEQLGGYALFAGRTSRPLCLDLADGLAGVGYQLLRVLQPSTLPAILLMD